MKPGMVRCKLGCVLNPDRCLTDVLAQIFTIEPVCPDVVGFICKTMMHLPDTFIFATDRVLLISVPLPDDQYRTFMGGSPLARQLDLHNC